jgi:hypothetical protein
MSVDGDHESPWFRARGSESCAKVHGLGEGDRVSLVIDTGKLNQHSVILLEAGPNSIQISGMRFKLCKQSGGVRPPVPTTVEIFHL